MLTPFLKWAGGKRWLVENEDFKIPRTYNRYVEPFLGGGAVFFSLRPDAAILSDLNPRLIETYRAIRNQHADVKRHLTELSAKHNDNFYYEMRRAKFRTQAERAAQFLYLNRTCFNGIYRENLKGEFNVPRGSKNTIVFPNDNFEEWSRALRSAELIVSDFESVIDNTEEGDFVFADPPYTVRHNRNGFVKYNQKIFSWEDQKRLAACLYRAHQRRVRFVLTNADHEVIRQLYSGFENLKPIARSSVVAASASKRSQTTELFIASFD